MAHSIVQLLSTVVPLAGLWTAMMLTLDGASWVTWPLSVAAAAFMVRLFIIQHDCGHGSYFRSRRLNDALGAVIGIITLTPYDYWRRAHNIHHATSGNLQKRGIGDVRLLTVAEYTALPGWKRLAYRIYRTPAVMLGIGPVYLFLLKYRLPLDLIWRHPKALISVMGSNLAVAGVLAGLGYSFGIIDVLMVHGSIVLLAGAAGIWLFYVQHQFEYTYWRKEGGWRLHEASVMASSFLRPAATAALVFRQHRHPPHPSPVLPHSQLSSRRLSGRYPGAPNPQPHWFSRQPFVPPSRALGRKRAAPDIVQEPAPGAIKKLFRRALAQGLVLRLLHTEAHLLR